ncbi:MAG: hypothetical protein WC242_05295 [Candidatus Paceibacterota bacterium]|jgi:hypothetical protein
MTREKIRQECKHKWASLIGNIDGKEVKTAVFACVTCGQLKVGIHSIRISKNRLDMGGKDIENAGHIHASAVYGAVYGDLKFEETECAVCGKKFKRQERIVLYVKKTSKKGIFSIPAHLSCLK